MNNSLPLDRDAPAVPLLSCPFCGGNAELTTAQIAADTWSWGVECLGCDAQNTGFSEERTAIAAWNRRVQKATP